MLLMDIYKQKSGYLNNLFSYLLHRSKFLLRIFDSNHSRLEPISEESMQRWKNWGYINKNVWNSVSDLGYKIRLFKFLPMSLIPVLLNEEKFLAWCDQNSSKTYIPERWWKEECSDQNISRCQRYEVLCNSCTWFQDDVCRILHLHQQLWRSEPILTLKRRSIKQTKRPQTIILQTNWQHKKSK